jgi:hypothetical protein
MKSQTTRAELIDICLHDLSFAIKAVPRPTKFISLSVTVIWGYHLVAKLIYS